MSPVIKSSMEARYSIANTMLNNGKAWRMHAVYKQRKLQHCHASFIREVPRGTPLRDRAAELLVLLALPQAPELEAALGPCDSAERPGGSDDSDEGKDLTTRGPAVGKGLTTKVGWAGLAISSHKL